MTGVTDTKGRRIDPATEGAVSSQQPRQISSHKQADITIHASGAETADGNSGDIDVADYYGAELCVPPKTLVYTNPAVKSIEDIQVDDKVLTHEGTYRRVTKLFKRPYNGELIELTPYHGQPVRLTPKHPVYVKSQEGNTWVEARELKAGDMVILVPPNEKNRKITLRISEFLDRNLYKRIRKNSHYYVRSKGSKGKFIKDSIKLNCDFMRLAGYYIAEGSTSSSSIVQFTFNSKEEEYISDVVNILRSLGLEPRIRYRGNRGIVYFCNKLIMLLFKTLFGKNARTKQIPVFMMSLGKNKQFHLLKGIFRGDGSKWKKTRRTIELCTYSQKLAYQISLILFRLGRINSVVYDKYRDRYFVRVSGWDGRWLSHQFFGTSKQSLKHHFYPNSPTKGVSQDGLIYLPLRKVSKIQYQGIVHNLQVEEANSYTLPSMAVHNCLDITAVSGTNPSMDVYIEGKDPVSGKYKVLDSHTGITATGTYWTTITDLIFRYIRARWSISGTSPSFTFSVGGSAKV